MKRILSVSDSRYFLWRVDDNDNDNDNAVDDINIVSTDANFLAAVSGMDERLSWPSWLTCSGQLTHIS